MKHTSWIQVGTFYDSADKLCVKNVKAYTRDYKRVSSLNPGWHLMRTFWVLAKNSTEAKKKAIQMRLGYERQETEV